MLIFMSSILNWGKIATKYLLPELAGSQLTPKLCNRVAEAFVAKYGKYAGWAQTLLFIAELPSQKALLPSHLWTIKQHNPAKVEDSEERVGKKINCSLSILAFKRGIQNSTVMADNLPFPFFY